MKEEKEVKISWIAAHATTLISVTLVLLLVGIIAMMVTATAVQTHRLEEKVELSAILVDSVSDSQAKQIAAEIGKSDFCGSTSIITKEEAARRWKADMGEDLEELFGVNPLSPEVSFTLKAPYVSTDSIKAIIASVSRIQGVNEVIQPDTAMIDSMKSNISAFSWVLGIIAAIMLIISFALINNTVHLTIYSRRFTIHTMKLVGATNGFIRRPIVLSNMSVGLIGGLLASGVIAVALAAAPKYGINDMADYISWTAYAMIAGGITLLGMVICSIAASIAATSYLRKDYSQLFR